MALDLLSTVWFLKTLFTTVFLIFNYPLPTLIYVICPRKMRPCTHQSTSAVHFSIFPAGFGPNVTLNVKCGAVHVAGKFHIQFHWFQLREMMLEQRL